MVEVGSDKYMKYLRWCSSNDDTVGICGVHFNEEDDIADEINEHGFGIASNIKISNEESFATPRFKNNEGFGDGTTIHSQMSQESIELDSYLSQDNTENPSIVRGGDLWNRVEQFMNTIKTTEQRDRFCEFYERRGGKKHC